MKFDKNDSKTIFPNVQRPIIYLLLNGDEVVYVGQSKIGLARPYNHRDKIFTDIAIIYCEENELDRKETDYIRKYKPKYNGNIGRCDYSFGKAKEIIKKETKINKFNVFDLRKLIKRLEIETYDFNGLSYMGDEDFERALQHVKDNIEKYRRGIY